MCMAVSVPLPPCTRCCTQSPLTGVAPTTCPSIHLQGLVVTSVNCTDEFDEDHHGAHCIALCRPEEPCPAATYSQYGRHPLHAPHLRLESDSDSLAGRVPSTWHLLLTTYYLLLTNYYLSRRPDSIDLVHGGDAAAHTCLQSGWRLPAREA